MQALDAARLEPLIGPDGWPASRRSPRGTESAARRPHGDERELDRDRGRRRRDAADAARVRARRRPRHALARHPGRPAFFEITKRIHNRLYGSPGRRRPARRGRATATTSASCAGTPTSCWRSSGRRTSCPDPRPAARRARRGDVRAPAPRSSGAATSAPTSRTSGPSASWDVPAPVPRGGRRDSCSRARAFAPPWADAGAGARHPALDRPVLGQERADLTAQRALASSGTPACSTAMERCPRFRSPAATVRPARSTAAPTSSRPGPRRRPTRRWSSRSRAGTG